MKIFLIFTMVISIYAQDLKSRIEKLITPLETKKIVYIKYDPFQKAQVVVQEAIEQKTQENTFYIMSILNNRVFVNSHWYSVGDEVNGYKILQIRKDSVLAKNSEKVVKFGVKRRNNIVKVEDK